MDGTVFMFVKAFEINIEKAFKKCFWSSPHNEKFEQSFASFPKVYIVFATLAKGKVMLQGLARMTGPATLEPFDWPRLAKSYNANCFPIEWIAKNANLGGLPPKCPTLSDGMRLGIGLAKELVKRLNGVAQKRQLEGRGQLQEILSAFPELPATHIATKQKKRRGIYDHRVDTRRQPTLEDLLG